MPVASGVDPGCQVFGYSTEKPLVVHCWPHHRKPGSGVGVDATVGDGVGMGVGIAVGATVGAIVGTLVAAGSGVGTVLAGE